MQTTFRMRLTVYPLYWLVLQLELGTASGKPAFGMSELGPRLMEPTKQRPGQRLCRGDQVVPPRCPGQRNTSGTLNGISSGRAPDGA
jgi:hypothetical protein